VTFAKNLLVSGSETETILWDMASPNTFRDTALRRACAVTAGGLDPAQWGRLSQDLPYHDACGPA
jgi:hypothetical protein